MNVCVRRSLMGVSAYVGIGGTVLGHLYPPPRLFYGVIYCTILFQY